MSIQVALNHRTEYRYDRLVSLTPHLVRLRPAPHCRTLIRSYSLKIEPPKHFLNWQQDPQSNYIARVVFPEKTRNLKIEVDLVADLTVVNPFDFFLEPSAETFPFRYDRWLDRELRPFLEIEEQSSLLDQFLQTIDRSPRQVVDFLVDLNQRLSGEIRYVIRLEPGVQTCQQTLELRSGSCRDSGWLLVQVLRRLGLAARFVSGYLIQLKPDVAALDGPLGPAVDFTDLHAWTEVYLPGAGWVGLDPTSGLFAGEGHLPIAATPDPISAAPITGGVDECEVEFGHTMSVVRIHEDPRVTRPYTEAQWEAIDRLGHAVDRDLESGDVRLTMGGEPTFVSIDDMQGAEWNTEALGLEKRRRAEELIRRLRSRFAPGALLHYGQGKWYPGEPLPRWALACVWRRDGLPLWQDEDLVADARRDYRFETPDAGRFLTTLAENLGIDAGYVIGAYEDPLFYLQKERQLPVNLSPDDNRLERPEDRERLRQVFERGLGQPAGFILPIRPARDPMSGRLWESGMWMVQGRHLFLIPGDSPIGLRLPLASLPWVDPRHAPHLYLRDPFARVGELPQPDYRSVGRQLPGVARPGLAPADRAPASGESADWVVRTAAAVQARNGRVHVFMPPLELAEDYVEFVASVERTAAALGMPVVVEGYTPPEDSRMGVLKVTPDPGVIEVNIHPVRSWEELVSNTMGLYEDARQSRLGTEKFLVDGRHSGTGGGNHFVMGGASPADSPFLRRPDLLRSLLVYWVNHPSLSYLFSGLFIGPTSQAPRVDETRADSISELEIALSEIDRQGPECPPWLVDRIFRHLLVDVTGNTHRTEFCIDKLYAPETVTGRLGLVELRSFEMPPHPRMSLVEQLLLRALVSRFWKEPSRESPVHWGTRLHDDFMLPHCVFSDFSDVIDDLDRAGYAFEKDWFAPHFEFRYPFFGRVGYRGVEVELRCATEPWYVLGEEPGASGTARYVDSSVERLQARVSGLNEERFVVAVNGRRLPLHPTGVQGEYVAGVRYRAWQPPSCLHPTIGVHSPLVFDVIDTWSGRSIGGCTYHVAHPGGRNYETFPVNAYEAEARRNARFFPFGHTPGPMMTPLREENPKFPRTLDLRRPAAAQR